MREKALERVPFWSVDNREGGGVLSAASFSVITLYCLMRRKLHRVALTSDFTR